MGKKGPERRRNPRLVVGGDAEARVTAIYETSLVDISVGGALIEHAHIVRPGTMSYLILTLKGRDVSVACRAIRSLVHRPEMDPEGERTLVYRTGLEYVDLSDETLRLLDEYILTGMEGSHGPPAEP